LLEEENKMTKAQQVNFIPLPTQQIAPLLRAMYYAAFQKAPIDDAIASMEMFGALIEYSNTSMKDFEKITKRELLNCLLDKICHR
jgi:hypothetical protein